MAAAMLGSVACNPQSQPRSEFTKEDLRMFHAYDKAIRPKDISALRNALKHDEISQAQFEYLLAKTSKQPIIFLLSEVRAARNKASARTEAERQDRDSVEFAIQVLTKANHTEALGK